MSKNWTSDELSNLETKVASLESLKASDPTGWWTARDGRARAISMRANLTQQPPDNLVADALVQRHKSVVDRLAGII